MLLEIGFVTLGLGSLVAAGILGIDPAIPAFLLFASIVFTIIERWLRAKLVDKSRTDARKKWKAQEEWLANKRMDQLVSIETLFGDR